MTYSRFAKSARSVNCHLNKLQKGDKQVITVKGMESISQLDEQSKERDVKRGFDMMMDMSAAAANMARQIGNTEDSHVMSAKAAIYNFETKEIDLVYGI